MTSMKKLVMVLVMALMLAASVFAEAHKKQKVVMAIADNFSIPLVSVSGGKATIKEPKTSKVDIPDGWHVVHMFVTQGSAQTFFYFVLEEN